MRKLVNFAVFVVCCICTVSSARADGGRIPIWEESVITAPGHYYVTRNIPADPVQFPIQISSNDVILDLNGFTLQSDGAVVVIDNGRNGITIRNGTVSTGTNDPSIIGTNNNGVTIEDVRFASAAAMDFTNLNNFHFRRLYGPGWISLSGGNGTIADCQLWGDVGVSGVSIRLERNSISAESPLSVSGTQMVVRGNLVSGVFSGISSSGCEGCLVVGNSVTSDLGQYLLGGAFTGSTILDNRVFGGLFGAGIRVSGSFNLIRSNLVQGVDGVGLDITGDSNVYGGNLSRGNTTQFSDSGTGNTSEGDNFIPTVQ